MLRPLSVDTAQRLLVEIWRQVLGRPDVGVDDPFFALGGDSLDRLRMVALARERGLHITVRQFLGLPTIRQLSAVAVFADQDSREPAESWPDRPLQLTPSQRWFFELDTPTPQHWDHVVLFEVDEPMDLDLLGEVVAEVTDRHDSLRLRFVRDDRGRRQHVAPASETESVAHRVDLTTVAARNRVAVLDRHATRLQIARDLATGPLMLVLYGTTPADEPDILLISIHHLAVDGHSHVIVQEDLFAAYGRLRGADTTEPPAPTTPFAAFASWLERHTVSGAVAGEREFWLAQVARDALPLPPDRRIGRPDEASVRTRELLLDRATTAALSTTFGSRVQDAVVTALSIALSTRTGDGEVVVDLVNHGRQPAALDADLSRTVGWLSHVFPVRVPLDSAEEPERTLDRVAQRLSDIPNSGLGYGLLRGVADEELRVPASRAQVVLNYHGKSVARSRQRPMRTGPMTVRSPRALRPWPIACHAGITDGRFGMRVVYSDNRFDDRTIAALCEDCRNALHALVS